MGKKHDKVYNGYAYFIALQDNLYPWDSMLSVPLLYHSGLLFSDRYQEQYFKG